MCNINIFSSITNSSFLFLYYVWNKNLKMSYSERRWDPWRCPYDVRLQYHMCCSWRMWQRSNGKLEIAVQIHSSVYQLLMEFKNLFATPNLVLSRVFLPKRWKLMANLRALLGNSVLILGRFSLTSRWQWNSSRPSENLCNASSCCFLWRFQLLLLCQKMSYSALWRGRRGRLPLVEDILVPFWIQGALLPYWLRFRGLRHSECSSGVARIGRLSSATEPRVFILSEAARAPMRVTRLGARARARLSGACRIWSDNELIKTIDRAPWVMGGASRS